MKAFCNLLNIQHYFSTSCATLIYVASFSEFEKLARSFLDAFVSPCSPRDGCQSSPDIICGAALKMNVCTQSAERRLRSSELSTLS